MKTKGIADSTCRLGGGCSIQLSYGSGKRHRSRISNLRGETKAGAVGIEHPPCGKRASFGQILARERTDAWLDILTEATRINHTAHGIALVVARAAAEDLGVPVEVVTGLLEIERGDPRVTR